MNNNYLTGLDPNLYGLTSPQPQNNVGYQQPVMNQSPLGQRSNSPVFNIINSEMEFNAQVVLPGLTVFSYSPNENRLFIKTNPGNGMPPQSRYFNCVEYFPQATQPVQNTLEEVKPSPEYVTVEQFNDLKNLIMQLGQSANTQNQNQQNKQPDKQKGGNR